jgi:hypothetical protein
MTVTSDTTPKVEVWKVPAYFGGKKGPHEYDFDHAVDALVALSGRRESDAAVRLIVQALYEAHGDLMERSYSFGQCVGDRVDAAGGIDNWPEDVYLELTGRDYDKDFPSPNEEAAS